MDLIIKASGKTNLVVVAEEIKGEIRKQYSKAVS
jgi:hypothetical protein